DRSRRGAVHVHLDRLLLQGLKAVFSPEEFIHLAGEIARGTGLTGSSAGRARTAYGRAYYGLFLIVRSILVHRHGIPVRRIEHGPLHMRLQHSTIRGELRDLGRELQRLYSLRRTADYEIAPPHQWRRRVEDPGIAAVAAGQALKFARRA